jgi:hypothetical protein
MGTGDAKNTIAKEQLEPAYPPGRSRVRAYLETKSFQILFCDVFRLGILEPHDASHLVTRVADDPRSSRST